LILSVHAALTLPTLGRQGVNWDEQTDLDIASVYAASTYGLIHGSPDDAVNTRLPMFTTGMFLRIYGERPLLLARLISAVLAALTVVGVFMFCLLELDRARALVAAALLASSPYFLFFGKLALTEGDVWITAAMAWLLVAAAWYRRRENTGRAAILGLALGLVISAKISGLALIPAVVLLIVLQARTPDQTAGITSDSKRMRGTFLLLALAGFVAWAGVNVIASLAVISQSPLTLAVVRIHPLLRLAAGVLLVLVLMYWIVVHRRERLGAFWSVLVCLLVGAFTFFLVPPVHVTNPRILAELGNQFLRGDAGFDLPFAAEAGGFHVAVIAIKSSPAIGVGLWVGLALAVARVRRRPALRFALIGFVSYFGFLLLLPWAQTRYMMPLLPALVVFAADALVEFHRRRRLMARTAVALASLLLVVDIVSCYPDLNFVGQPWLGGRYIAGRSTLGYRGVVHTGSDGIEQSLRWVAERAGPDEQVVTVYGEVHITRAVLAGTRLQTASILHDPVDLGDADWVITSLNYDIQPRAERNAGGGSIYTYPHYDRLTLEREFRKVFSVERGFGIEVAAVWRRTEHRRGR
jgi:hypothetical protein